MWQERLICMGCIQQFKWEIKTQCHKTKYCKMKHKLLSGQNILKVLQWKGADMPKIHAFDFNLDMY